MGGGNVQAVVAGCREHGVSPRRVGVGHRAVVQLPSQRLKRLCNCLAPCAVCEQHPRSARRHCAQPRHDGCCRRDPELRNAGREVDYAQLRHSIRGVRPLACRRYAGKQVGA